MSACGLRIRLEPRSPACLLIGLKKKREKLALEKGKKRARDEDDEAMADKMDAGFQFDAFGGGELGAAAVRNGSKKYGRTDAWVSQAQTCKAELLY